VWIQGDIDAVGICVLNLLENAQRHSTPDTFINVRIYDSGVLEIENDCLAIPPDQLEQIAQRHVRCSNISTGSGLGLSIVSSIIHQMGGDLTFSSPSRSGNRGFKVSVVFGRTS
jgi:two-component system OmpR family sensor kinase